MEQYKAYLEETYKGHSCYIDPEARGWASYIINGEECYIDHCFLSPEARHGKLSMSMICSEIEKIAKDKGCKFMTGTIQIGTGIPERSIRMMMTDGYRIHSANNNIITMIKYLE
jgi:hypothetical protein